MFQEQEPNKIRLDRLYSILNEKFFRQKVFQKHYDKSFGKQITKKIN